MHIFNWDLFKAQKSVNPINGVCCYSDVQFSPDGEYLLFAFQDVAQGKNSNTQYFYIPFGTIGSGATYKPLPLPGNSNLKENPQLILRPAGLEIQPQPNGDSGTGQTTSPSEMTVTPEPTR